MTCEQYERLLAESRSACQACGIPAHDTSLGALVIDHDYDHGIWAVRGLVCNRCNSLLLRGTAPDWAKAYLDNVWFRRELERLRLAVEWPAEPPRDACFRDFDGHVWFFEGDAWRWAWNKSPRLTWSELFYRFGPAGLTAVDPSELAASRGYKTYLKCRELRQAGPTS